MFGYAQAKKYAKRGLVILMSAAAMLCAGCGKKTVDYSAIAVEGLQIDAAMYQPGSTVNGTFTVKNSGEQAITVPLALQAQYLENTVEMQKIEKVELAGGEEKTVSFAWKAPETDFRGYLLEIGAGDRKTLQCVFDTIGVDVSSSWAKFPRYGFLSEFTEDIDVADRIEKMTRYHINGIEYYDWHYRHHEPVPDDGRMVWDDWSGRTVNGEVIRSLIAEAKKRGMTSMAYNMIYAATDCFFKENPDAENWKIFFAPENTRGEGNFTFHMGYSPSGNSNLFFVNPLNEQWQQHIFSKTVHALDVMGFDGWHGDSVGDWGEMVDAQGNPLGYENGEPINTVKDTYTLFLNAAKEALGDYQLSFNPVGAQGIDKANCSKADVLYAEFWPWDSSRTGEQYDTYHALAQEVEYGFEDSKEQSMDGKGKSLTVKAYINYERTCGYMNPAGVLLCDAAVFAAGGNRLELGDGDNMLHVEYYPKHNVLMSEELKEKMIRMMDFAVAYENLLRDGQKAVEKRVSIDHVETSDRGGKNKVWTYTREDEAYEMLHLINLVGTDNLWRDEMAKKHAPELQENMQVTYYTDSPIEHIYLASPDFGSCMSEELDFETGSDENGTYVTFHVNSLEYWDMIYMKKGTN